MAGAIYLAIFAYCAVASSILAPYSDMVDLVGDYFRAVDQGGTVDYLMGPHNFHRLPWFRGLIALDVGLFRGTGLPLVASGLLSLTGIAALLVAEIRRVGGAIRLPLMALTGMLVFLTAHAAGVSVPANTPHLHTTFFSVLSLIAAASAGETERGWGYWIASLLSAAAACFSLATAIVLWPILMLMALRGKASWVATLLVAILGAGFCAAYLTGQPVGSSLQQGFEPAGLVKAAEYFLGYLGLPWVRGSKLFGEFCGAGVLVASVTAVIRYGFTEINRTQRLALGMILFSLATAVLAAVGRRDIGVGIDIPVRYAILMGPLHVGLLLLATPAIVRAWQSQPRLVAQGLVAALALLMVQQVLVGIVVVRAAERARETIALYQQGQRTPEMLQFIYPDLEKAAAVYAEMRRRGVFMDWVSALKAPAVSDGNLLQTLPKEPVALPSAQ